MVYVPPVSSELQFIKGHPEYKSSFLRMEHELRYLKRVERISSIVAFTSTVLAMVSLAGLLGAGHIIFGALVTIALIAALLVYACRQAELALRSKQIGWIQQDREKSLPAANTPEAPKDALNK